MSNLETPSPPWRALRTNPRAEKAVRDTLTERCIEVFLPTVTRRQRWKDRTKTIEWPLFPGYCFARVGPSHQLTALQCRGVISIVSFAGIQATIPDQEIENLRTLISSHLALEPIPFLREGTRVQVIHGPLAGMVGRLVRQDQRARLVLSVDLIALAVSVDVDAADVRQL
ncbi:MAG: UpxY family transcription antiterminator [Vicinamibacterales bacterium]